MKRVRSASTGFCRAKGSVSSCCSCSTEPSTRSIAFSVSIPSSIRKTRRRMTSPGRRRCTAPMSSFAVGVAAPSISTIRSPSSSTADAGMPSTNPLTTTPRPMSRPVSMRMPSAPRGIRSTCRETTPTRRCRCSAPRPGRESTPSSSERGARRATSASSAACRSANDGASSCETRRAVSVDVGTRAKSVSRIFGSNSIGGAARPCTETSIADIAAESAIAPSPPLRTTLVEGTRRIGAMLPPFPRRRRLLTASSRGAIARSSWRSRRPRARANEPSPRSPRGSAPPGRRRRRPQAGIPPRRSPLPPQARRRSARGPRARRCSRPRRRRRDRAAAPREAGATPRAASKAARSGTPPRRTPQAAHPRAPPPSRAPPPLVRR